MNSHVIAAGGKRGVRLVDVCLVAIAILLPATAAAKQAGTCTEGTTLRLSAPQASQGSLLLIDIKSTKPLAEGQADWGGRKTPILGAHGGEKQPKSIPARCHPNAASLHIVQRP